MADVAVTLRWAGEGLLFDGDVRGGVSVRVDGHGRLEVSPVQLLLVSLAGCTASDVVEILGKMRIPLGGLEVSLEGDRAENPPRRYVRVRMVYRTAGVDPGEEENVRRAIALSHDKYCSVLHTLRPELEVSTALEMR